MKRDQLDEAIDITAARMTAVEDNDALAARIVGALPGRAPWSWYSLVPRLATGALAGLAIAVVLRTFDGGSTIVLRRFDESSTKVLRTENTPAPVTTVEPPSNDRRTSVVPSSNDRSTPVEPSSNVRRTDGDHAFSLVAIDAPGELLLQPLAPSELASAPALELEPLAIADLPLTAEFPQR